MRELADGESTVSGARLGSIAHAVRRLADLASPDRLAQARRIDEEIAELRRRKEDVLQGRAGTATAGQVREQLSEVLAMTRSLPADFRQLRSMVEERHKVLARDALAQTPKADMVESYLHENDLLASTPEGVAYRRFARMLSSSDESATIQRDLGQILATPFAREQMTAAQKSGPSSRSSGPWPVTCSCPPRISLRYGPGSTATVSAATSRWCRVPPTCRSAPTTPGRSRPCWTLPPALPRVDQQGTGAVRLPVRGERHRSRRPAPRRRRGPGDQGGHAHRRQPAGNQGGCAAPVPVGGPGSPIPPGPGSPGGRACSTPVST